MKRLLFWISFLPAGALLLLLGPLPRLCDRYEDAVDRFERWCFDLPQRRRRAWAHSDMGAA